MSVQWAGLGPELLLLLDRSLAEPLRSQLEREMRDAIRSGRLAAGERLPSSRELARELGISRGLVLECYTQLQAEGYLTARAGSATRVAAGAHEVPAVVEPPRPAAKLDVDFRPGVPDLGSFPRGDWMWALRDAHRTASADALGYGDARGQRRLREVLASYLRRVRGADADPDCLVICSGFAQGINLLLSVLAAEGAQRFALENPGDRDLLAALERRGLEGLPVAVDEEGIDVQALTDSRAEAVLLTPAHQFPTGVVLGAQRRPALIEWAVQTGATVVEDDYDAEFRYDRDPVGLLQGLAPERVAAVGTVSKSLAPGLRLGWILCPPRLLEAIAEEKELADRGSPWAEQLALAGLIESGRFDRHLRRMRTVYGARREVLRETLTRLAPAVELSGLAAGFHAVAELPEGVEEGAVSAAARERGVGVYPMAEYRLDRAPGPAQLVLGFGNLSEAAIKRGVTSIAELIRG